MSISKFFKEAVAYRVLGGHTADHVAMKVATYATNSLTGKVTGIVDPSGGVAFSNPVQRLRNSLSAAQAKNILTSQPLIAPSAWTISTAYVAVRVDPIVFTPTMVATFVAPEVPATPCIP